MADERDFRVRMDLCFPPEVQDKAEQIKDFLLILYENAVVINDERENEERGFIDVERCGHRLGLSCEKIARWEVGKGKVI